MINRILRNLRYINTKDIFTYITMTLNSAKESVFNDYKILEKIFLKRIRSGQPTKYDADKHPKLLLKIFLNCEGVEAFCAEALISRRTFYDWLDAHEGFKEAYAISKELGATLWEKKAVIDKTINFNHWERTKRTRYEKGTSGFKFNSLAPIDIIDTALKGFERGELTAQESVNFSTIATAKNNIVEGIPVENHNKRLTTIEMELERQQALEDKKQQLEILTHRIKALENSTECAKEAL